MRRRFTRVGGKGGPFRKGRWRPPPKLVPPKPRPWHHKPIWERDLQVKSAALAVCLIAAPLFGMTYWLFGAGGQIAGLALGGAIVYGGYFVMLALIGLALWIGQTLKAKRKGPETRGPTSTSSGH